jgi:hypothetical protein
MVPFDLNLAFIDFSPSTMSAAGTSTPAPPAAETSAPPAAETSAPPAPATSAPTEPCPVKFFVNPDISDGKISSFDFL